MWRNDNEFVEQFEQFLIIEFGQLIDSDDESEHDDHRLPIRSEGLRRGLLRPNRRHLRNHADVPLRPEGLRRRPMRSHGPDLLTENLNLFKETPNPSRLCS